MTPEQFRAEFPALETWAWLDTPGAPPSATRVDAALRAVLDGWRAGTFAWEDWDGAAQRARDAFAAWMGLPAARIATLGSLAEAAATVAQYRAPGAALIAADEFQSLLLPFVAVAERDATRPLVRARPRFGQSRTEALCEHLQPGISLVAVSETTTRDGERLDIAAVRDRADDVGAQLFVNGTQSLGVLDPRFARTRPDFYAVHGYKWLLAPRGAAWLYTAEGAAELGSIAPNWKTAEGGDGLFGGHPTPAGKPHAADTSPAWFSWIGAEAALGLISELDAPATESHALGLAEQYERGATELGARAVRVGPGSHIRVFEIAEPARVQREHDQDRIRARIAGDRLRIGVHGFTSSEDVERALAALERGLRG
ncbi:aminotransferase class V-fold PLP-dependent enzyme [Leucobacter sp. 7(1)]|uniref:aminotransferase class V-fold PLP-dependent enzyme n=1 Tax=Leucobacter sp. 7(1) TaxID=1255613 RepID=UPI000B359E91|nr:aminotransferase class V-fold PLP-dependent enzyme [Leucobacter sp. 7(1)]